MAASLRDEPRRRQRHALLAKEAALRVALDAAASAEERASARDVVAEAMGLNGELAEIAERFAAPVSDGQSLGVEID
jgi:hypothetical protein